MNMNMGALNGLLITGIFPDQDTEAGYKTAKSRGNVKADPGFLDTVDAGKVHGTGTSTGTGTGTDTGVGESNYQKIESKKLAADTPVLAVRLINTFAGFFIRSKR